MHDRPTEQRQPENQTATSDASSDQQLGPITPVGIPIKPNHQHTFLPLNPDFVPPSLFPLLEPVKEDDERRNHTSPMNNVHSVKQKDTNNKEGPKKFPGSHKSTQPALTKPPIAPHELDGIHITTTTKASETATIATTEVSTVLGTKEQEEPKSLNKARRPDHKDVPKTEGKLEPYHVKPPFLPDYEEDPLDDSEQPIMWIHPQHHNNKNNHDHSSPDSEDGNLSSVRPNKPSSDNPPYSVQNHLNPAEYFVPPNSRPIPGSRDVFQVQDIPGSAEIQHQRPSPGHPIEGPSDPHLDQILMHLQRQGILPEHYTILQQEGPPSHNGSPQHQRIQLPSQHGDVIEKPDNRPPYESESHDIHIHPSLGRIPPQYSNDYVPKPIPGPGQHPSVYQTAIPRPLSNRPRNTLPHPLLTNRYLGQSGRQPDTEGPLVANLPYQGLLVPHQYRVPPHVDIDHLLLTSQGRHNQSNPG
jgi:hypothetical protein